MKVFAYCDRAFVQSMRWVAGVEPVTCPPMTAALFDLRQLEGRDLILIDLHGERGADEWYAKGEGAGGIPMRTVALRAEQIRQADLGGAVVFGTSCYLGEADSPMLRALLDAGASCVIGGAGENLAGQSRLAGATLLAFWFRLFLQAGGQARWVLEMAKTVTRLTGGDGEGTQDAMAFQAFERGAIV